MGKHLHSAFAAKDPERFAALLERSEDVAGTLTVLREIPDGLECAVVNRLSADEAGRILGQVPDSTLIEWLESGPVKDGRLVLSKVPPERASAVVAGVKNSSKRRELRRLTAFPENSIGWLMQLDFLFLMLDDSAPEIESRIQQHKGSLEGPIVVQNFDGSYAGVLDPVHFLKNRREESTAADSCIRLEPVFANSPAAVLLQSDRWGGKNSLPVVNYERKPIGYVTRSALSNATVMEDTQGQPENALADISRWYWTFLLKGMNLALNRRPER